MQKILLRYYFLLTDMQEFSVIIILTVLSCLVSTFFFIIIFCIKLYFFAYKSLKYIQIYPIFCFVILSINFILKSPSKIVKYFLLALFLTWRTNFSNLFAIQSSESCKQRFLVEYFLHSQFPRLFCEILLTLSKCFLHHGSLSELLIDPYTNILHYCNDCSSMVRLIFISGKTTHNHCIVMQWHIWLFPFKIVIKAVPCHYIIFQVIDFNIFIKYIYILLQNFLDYCHIFIFPDGSQYRFIKFSQSQCNKTN